MLSTPELFEDLILLDVGALLEKIKMQNSVTATAHNLQEFWPLALLFGGPP